MIREVKEKQVYRHFKGALVKVLCLGRNSETNELMVIYRHLDTNEIWVRPLAMFTSLVDTKKYPNAKQKYRFEIVEDVQRI